MAATTLRYCPQSASAPLTTSGPVSSPALAHVTATAVRAPASFPAPAPPAPSPQPPPAEILANSKQHQC